MTDASEFLSDLFKQRLALSGQVSSDLIRVNCRETLFDKVFGRRRFPGSYSSCWFASDAFALNGSYAVEKDGAAFLSWTQSSATEGSSGNFGFGGFGGHGRR